MRGTTWGETERQSQRVEEEEDRGGKRGGQVRGEPVKASPAVVLTHANPVIFSPPDPTQCTVWSGAALLKAANGGGMDGWSKGKENHESKTQAK